MNWTLVHKYLSEECSPEEVQRVEDWLCADKRHRRFLDSLEKIWHVEPEDEMRVDAKSAWDAFQHKMSDEEEKSQRKESTYKIRKLRLKPPVRKTYSRSVIMALSASAVVILALLFSLYVPTGDKASAEQSRFTMQEIVTTKGQRTTFRLSDGTRVQLNADSKIEIPAEFMDSTRKVYLEGEAYFEVAHNPEKPFVVHSEETYTRVLGTKFGVRAYAGEDWVQVVVTEGKVALGSELQPDHKETHKEITRNQMGILPGNEDVRVADVRDIRPYLGWKDGLLVFEDTPLREVSADLERWFDITCRVTDPALNDRRITASFSGEPMTEVLNVVALSMDMRYEREGREIVFRKNE